MSMIRSSVTAGSAPAPSPAASRCTPSALDAPEPPSTRTSLTSAGSTNPSVPSVARSAAVRPLFSHWTSLASRSSLQLSMRSLTHNAIAAS
eukprot:scaffold128425_cov78-Phaeocystis_antarctica.AAC.1